MIIRAALSRALRPGPPRLQVSRDLPHPVPVVWRAVLDWEAHGRWIPLTSVTVRQGGGAVVGTRFVAVSRLGPLRLPDPMVVRAAVPPSGDSGGRVVIGKEGPLLRGRAEVLVSPLPGGGTRVVWREEVDVPPAALTRFVPAVVTVPGRLVFAFALRRLHGELDRTSGAVVVDAAAGPDAGTVTPPR